MSRRLIGAAVVLLALAGCGGDPKSEPPPSPSPSTTPVSTTPSTPAMPDAAKENTKAGAIAFVRHYVELINRAQATGDVSALAQVEDPACKSCEAARHGVAAHYQHGGAIHGGEWRIDSLSAIRNESISGWIIDLAVAYGDQTVSYGPSRPDKVNKAGRMIVSVRVKRSGNEWRVLQWTRAS